MKNDVWIKSRVSPELKERLRQLAAHEGRTESGQLKWLLLAAVASPEDRVAEPMPSSPTRRDARLWVRLSADDRRLLRERASARQMPAATYVALLVHAHLAEQPPLPREELVALKTAIGELAAVGRNLNHFVRALKSGTKGTGFTVNDGVTLIKVCERLRDGIKDLVRANAASWRGGSSHG